MSYSVWSFKFSNLASLATQIIQQFAVQVWQALTGVLCLFLLDMGIVAARRIKDIGREGATQIVSLVGLGLVIPLINGSAGLAVALALGLSEGDALLLVVLAASASYIAVPAAMRLALPEANPSVYLAMSLAITFPFNLLVGIPLYHSVIQYMLG